MLSGLELRIRIKCFPNFLDFVYENKANSSANSSLFIEGGRGLDFSLPVIVSMSLNSFLVSFPASIACEDSIWVLALLIMAMYFSSPF